MAGARGYHTYRGRTPKGKIALAVVLVLIILASAVFIFIQQFVVYDASGTPHLQLPGSQTQQEETEPDETEDVELTIDTPALTGAKLHALAQAPLTAADAQVALTAGGDGVVVTLKDSEGYVYYDSAMPQASASIQTQADTAAALSTLTGSEDCYTVARISCLLDPRAARADVEGMGLKNTGGYIFYDGNNLNWLDPSKSGTQEYLGGLVKECASMGFDEILLTDVSFPTEGKLNKIAYPGAGMQESIRAFLMAMDTALAAYPDVKLSVELPESVITLGQDETAGLVLSEIAPLVDRIYTETTEGSIPALEAAVEAAGEEAAFIPELTAAPADGEQPYLLLVQS